MLISHDDRALYRSTLKKVDELVQRVDKVARGQAEMTPDLARLLQQTCGTTDLHTQWQALSEMRDEISSEYDERLCDAARSDLSAFAEFINPEHPPAPHHLFICNHLHQVEAGEIPRSMLSMPPGHAKPLAPETPVMMGDGTWRRLDAITAGDFVVTGQGRPREVLAVHEQGQMTALKLTTACGRVVRAEPSHPILTPGGWVEAGDLEPGDHVTLVRDFELPDASGRSIAEFALAGYCISMGFARARPNSRVFTIADHFNSDDPEIIADFLELSKSLGFDNHTKRSYKYKQWNTTILFDEAMVAWLKEVGLHGQKRDTVQVPEWVLKGDMTRIGAFMGAIASMDALCIPRRGAPRSRWAQRQLSLITRSRALMHDLQRLMLRLGARARRTRLFRSNIHDKPLTFHYLTVEDPAGQVALRSSLRLVGSSKRFWALPITVDAYEHPTWTTAEIKTIEEDGTAEMRCLTVDEDASFLADGIVVHNSTYGSHLYPAWYLGRHPRRRYLQAGHSQKFCEEEFSKKVRGIVDSDRYRKVFPEVALSQDTANASKWMIAKHGGAYITRGVGQKIAGIRGDAGGADDLIGSREEAMSQTIRDKTYGWLWDDFETRFLPGAPVFYIACLMGDTPIHMADGTWKRLDAVQVDDEVMAWSEGKLRRRRVEATIPQGEDDIIEIRTRASVVRGNARHPLLVRREDRYEWVPIGSIQIKDEVVCAGLDSHGTRKDLSIDEAWALGFMFGDGWVTQNRKQNKHTNGGTYEAISWVTCLAVSKHHPERDARARAILTEKFGTRWHATKFGYYRAEKAVMGRWLHALGLGAGAKGKRIPPIVYQQEPAIRRAFLDGFMAADGWFVGSEGSQDHHKAKGGFASYRTKLANADLIQDLRHLARTTGHRVTNVTSSRGIGQPPNSKEPIEWEAHEFGFHFRDRNEEDFTTSPVRSIKNLGRAHVYDLTIEGDANFIADGIVVHNTRWHIDDPLGRLEEKSRKGEIGDFTIINMPALCTDPETDPLGRQLGEALWPTFFTVGEIERIRKGMEPGRFEALYQGNPVPSEGRMIKDNWLRRYDSLPQRNADPSLPPHKHTRRVSISVDCANKATNRADFSVITVWVESMDRKQHLADVIRKRLQFPDLCTEIENAATRWGATAILVEDAGAGTQYIQLRTGKAPAPVIPIKTNNNSKEFRFDAVLPMFEAGEVWIPAHNEAWLGEYLAELLIFPDGKHDDQVDSTSQYLHWARFRTRRGTKKAVGA